MLPKDHSEDSFASKHLVFSCIQKNCAKVRHSQHTTHTKTKITKSKKYKHKKTLHFLNYKETKNIHIYKHYIFKLKKQTENIFLMYKCILMVNINYKK